MRKSQAKASWHAIKITTLSKQPIILNTVLNTTIYTTVYKGKDKTYIHRTIKGREMIITLGTVSWYHQGIAK